MKNRFAQIPFVFVVIAFILSCSSSVEKEVVQKKIYICPECHKEYASLQKAIDCCKNNAELCGAQIRKKSCSPDAVRI